MPFTDVEIQEGSDGAGNQGGEKTTSLLLDNLGLKCLRRFEEKLNREMPGGGVWNRAKTREDAAILGLQIFANIYLSYFSFLEGSVRCKSGCQCDKYKYLYFKGQIFVL